MNSNIAEYLLDYYKQEIEIINNTKLLLLVDYNEIYLCDLDKENIKNPLEYIKHQHKYSTLSELFKKYIKDNYLDKFDLGLVVSKNLYNIPTNTIIYDSANDNSWYKYKVEDSYKYFMH